VGANPKTVEGHQHDIRIALQVDEVELENPNPLVVPVLQTLHEVGEKSPSTNDIEPFFS
jgi:hypothetical protein